MANRSDYALRPVTVDDSSLLLKWRNSDSVRKYMYTDHLIGEAEHVVWLDRMLADSTSSYLIFEVKGRPVGLVNVVDVNAIDSTCSWGFYIGENDAPSGIGAIMELLALEFIFNSLLINEIYCEVFAFNRAVIKLHKKFGFKEMDIEKQVHKNDVCESVVSLKLNKDDWNSCRKRIESIVFR